MIMMCLGLVLPAVADRPKIGLALGGGGAKGAAEVGVLKVLEEAGIHVDCIAGTSIGSIVGGLYAAGYSAKELETMFQTQEWLSLLTDRKASMNHGDRFLIHESWGQVFDSIITFLAYRRLSREVH